MRYLPSLPKNAIFKIPLPLPIEEQIVIVPNRNGSLLFSLSSEIQRGLVPFKSGQGALGDNVLSHQFQTVAIDLASDICVFLPNQSEALLRVLSGVSSKQPCLFVRAVQWRVTRGEKFQSQHIMQEEYCLQKSHCKLYWKLLPWPRMICP